MTSAATGVNLGLAKQLARNGFDVIIAAEDHGIHRAAVEIGADEAKVFPVELDLSTFYGVGSFYEHTRRFFSRCARGAPDGY